MGRQVITAVNPSVFHADDSDNGVDNGLSTRFVKDVLVEDEAGASRSIHKRLSMTSPLRRGA